MVLLDPGAKLVAEGRLRHACQRQVHSRRESYRRTCRLRGRAPPRIRHRARIPSRGDVDTAIASGAGPSTRRRRPASARRSEPAAHRRPSAPLGGTARCMAGDQPQPLASARLAVGARVGVRARRSTRPRLRSPDPRPAALPASARRDSHPEPVDEVAVLGLGRRPFVGRPRVHLRADDPPAARPRARSRNVVGQDLLRTRCDRRRSSTAGTRSGRRSAGEIDERDPTSTTIRSVTLHRVIATGRASGVKTVRELGRRARAPRRASSSSSGSTSTATRSLAVVRASPPSDLVTAQSTT